MYIYKKTNTCQDGGYWRNTLVFSLGRALLAGVEPRGLLRYSVHAVAQKLVLQQIDKKEGLIIIILKLLFHVKKINTVRFLKYVFI